MSCLKKLRTESNCQLFCQFCQQLDENKSEIVVLTDPKLTKLFGSSHEYSLEESQRETQHRITSFAIHDSSGRFCWFDSKPIEEGNQLFICGYVRPIVSDIESNEISNEEQNKIAVQMIGPLQEWWFAGFDGGPNLIIGVESEFSSYILCEPNDNYMNLFVKNTKNMFLTKIIIESLLKNPDSSYEDLILNLKESLKDFNEESIIEFSSFIVQQIESFDSCAEDEEVILSETQAFRTLVQLSGVNSLSNNSIQSGKKSISRVRPIARIDSRRAVNSDSMTYSTPLVTHFFDSVFKEVIECETNNQSKAKKSFESIPVTNSSKVFNSINKGIDWMGSVVLENKYTGTSYYSSLSINNIVYNLGDFVIFRENDSINFGRLMYIYRTSDKKNFCHIHYLCRGKDTILAESAPHFLLFMTTLCNDIKVQTIEDKINICLTNEFDFNSETFDNYFCTKLYFKESGRFEDLPKEAFKSDFDCISCLIKKKNEKLKIAETEDQIIDETNTNSKSKTYKKVVFMDEKYSMGDCALFDSHSFHINDFCYENQFPNSDEDYDQTLYPERYRKKFTNYIKGLNNDLPKTLNIGFIEKILKQNCDSNEEINLLVNVFYRPQNVYQNYSDFRKCDLNLLFCSNKQIIVGIDSIRGKCQVIYSNKSPETDFYSETKTFYFNQCFDFENNILLEPNQEFIKRFTSNNKELSDGYRTQFNVLDLFAGCGGLSYGFEKLGLVSKLWAIEKDSSPLQSFKANFKSSHVFQEDVNHVLDQLLKGVKCDKNGQKYPEKNEIDVVLGGPPCQGFSGMNRFNSRLYSLFKNSLIVSFLSFVDYYRPKYLIFENVRNFALFKNSLVLKLMLSCLICMGYQCHFAILQAGSYGLPQTRRRIVIIGAIAGTQLPSFPEPTHVFSRRQCQLSVTIDNKKYSALTKSCAQFRSITVDDAITDLPKLNEDFIFGVQNYEPFDNDLTHFQQIMRKDCHRLNDHFSKEINELCRLRIKNIPHKPGSDWRDLPNIEYTLKDGKVIKKLEYNFDDTRKGSMRGVCICAEGLQCNPNECRQENTLIPWCLVHTANRSYHWSGLYGRLALYGYFPTTVTNPEPISKQGRVLHPNEDRIISIRECARSQGFPDNFIFCGTVSDKYRQIGNAVPIPLSYALGRQFLTIT